MKRYTILLVCCVLLGLMVGAPSYSIEIDTSSSFLNADYSKRISMDFESASLVDVLKIFSQQTKLNLITAEGVSGMKVTVYFDNVPVEQALEQILRANNLTYEIQPGSDIYIVKPIQRPEVELVTRVYPLKYASVPSAQINNLLDVGESSADGLINALESVITGDGKIKEDARTNSLIVTDIATNFPMLEQTIARLDVSIPQILIEVEMLEVAKSLTDKAGIEWSGAFFTVNGAIKDSSFPFDGSVPFWDKQQEPGSAKGISTIGTMDASSLTATLSYLRSDTETKNLARPSILTLNNQSAEIKITTDEAIGVIESSQTEGIATVAYNAERTETGVSLIVTPQANVENGMIKMAVKPVVSLAKTGTDFGVATFRDPEERSAQTMLKIKSGDTIIIGGLLREETTTKVSKIPILGDIPFFGRPFRYNGTTTSERELLIFITPHILPDSETLPANKTIRKRLIREQEAPK